MDLDGGKLDAPQKAAQRALDSPKSRSSRRSKPRAAGRARADRATTTAALDRRAARYNPRYGGVFETLAHYELDAPQVSRGERLAAASGGGAAGSVVRAGGARREPAAPRRQSTKRAQHLEAAYSGDPFSATTVNTLRLLDNAEGLQRRSRRNRPASSLRSIKKESDAMRPYVEEVDAAQHRARSRSATASSRSKPITVELYPNHDDFAVRTAGLPGIGLLGVTFGYLVAMDSPSGRADRRLPLGQHAVARDGARVHALGHRPSRAALAERRHLGVRGMAHRPDAGRRRLPRALRRVRRGQVPARRHARRRLHPPRVRGPGAGVVHAERAHLPVHRAELGLRRSSSRCCASSRRDTTTAAAVEATFKIAPEDFDKEFTRFMKQRFAAHPREPEAVAGSRCARAHMAAEAKRTGTAASRSARRGHRDLPGLHAGGSAVPADRKALDEDAASATQPIDDAAALCARPAAGIRTALRQLAQWLRRRQAQRRSARSPRRRC